MGEYIHTINLGEAGILTMSSFYTLNKPEKNNRLDVTIVEASAITEDGGIIPGASVGASPELIQMADKIIIEVNTAAPSFEGLHDITMTDLPPRRKPYLIMSPEDRIGTPHIPIDPERVVAIVESDYPDQTQPNAPEDDTSRAIAGNLIEFLKHEVDHCECRCWWTRGTQFFIHFDRYSNANMNSRAVLISRTSKSGPKFSKTRFSTSSTLAISTLQQQHRSDSRPTASSASTRTGTSMHPNSSSDPNKSPTAPR
jgi:hypothetical protein